MNTRIYTVTTKGKEGIQDTVLVEAQTPSQALRMVAGKSFDVKVASAKETATLIGAGVGLLTLATATPEPTDG